MPRMEPFGVGDQTQPGRLEIAHFLAEMHPSNPERTATGPGSPPGDRHRWDARAMAACGFGAAMAGANLGTAHQATPATQLRCYHCEPAGPVWRSAAATFVPCTQMGMCG